MNTSPELHAKGTDLVRECVDRNTERPSKTKVPQFELPFPVDEKVLRLEVAVQYPVLVAECCTLEELVHETPNRDGIESATLAMDIHVLFEIAFTVLEDKDEFCLGMYHVV